MENESPCISNRELILNTIEKEGCFKIYVSSKTKYFMYAVKKLERQGKIKLISRGLPDRYGNYTHTYIKQQKEG